MFVYLTAGSWNVYCFTNHLNFFVILTQTSEGQHSSAAKYHYFAVVSEKKENFVLTHEASDGNLNTHDLLYYTRSEVFFIIIIIIILPFPS